MLNFFPLRVLTHFSLLIFLQIATVEKVRNVLQSTMRTLSIRPAKILLQVYTCMCVHCYCT